MTEAFWQHLLAAELPSHKSREFVELLGTSNLDPVSLLLSSPRLTETEKSQARNADLRALELSLQKGVQVLQGGSLPAGVSNTRFSPPALFAWGEAAVLEKTCVGIVGTRNATTYGRACAQKFAEHLAGSDVAVVSGGALGIDAAAHRGALSAGGSTIAVLATGVDQVYPFKHKELFATIRANGCLISQWACGSRAARGYRFLIRNHLIAALSDAVIVIEAPEISGALTTARVAAELGRPVFVVPANIDNTNFRGSHALVRDGATLVDHPDQVLEALNIKPVFVPKRATEEHLTQTQSRIVDALSCDPVLPESIVTTTGLPPSEVLAELTMLELSGVVIQDGGRYALRP